LQEEEPAEGRAPDPRTDLVTGKQKVQPKAKASLFLPGRILHITWGTSVAKYVHRLAMCCYHFIHL